MSVPNFKDTSGDYVKFHCVKRKTIRTQSGLVWSNIKNRCTPRNVRQINAPEYIGCAMSENFKNFNFFVEWHMAQIGFGLEGYQIDKDVLISGNRLYSEDCCVLVPAALNSFFIKHKGDLPQGVSVHKQSGRYRATMTIAKKSLHIGLFDTVDGADMAYRIVKAREALNWAQRLEAGEFVIDKRVIERLKVWEV